MLGHESRLNMLCTFTTGCAGERIGDHKTNHEKTETNPLRMSVRSIDYLGTIDRESTNLRLSTNVVWNNGP
jgi:hypothetical protein